MDARTAKVVLGEKEVEELTFQFWKILQTSSDQDMKIDSWNRWKSPEINLIYGQ